MFVDAIHYTNEPMIYITIINKIEISIIIIFLKKAGNPVCLSVYPCTSEG